MPSVSFWAALVAAVVLGLVHVFTPSMRFLEGTPRSAWLSIAGGVAVAYVFIHLLPELARGQQHVGRVVGDVGVGGIRFSERHVYLIALLGLVVFYGLDRMAKRSRGQVPEGDSPSSRGTAGGGERGGSGRATATPPDTVTSPAVFWIHMASFGIYNALIGYLLLHRETPGLVSLVFFAVAMALHFLVTDYGLNEDHKAQYRRVGQWVLVVAVFGGLALGALTKLSDTAIAVLVAFLAGGVILNVLKEEVPAERRSRFWAFALGITGYTVLLLTL